MNGIASFRTLTYAGRWGKISPSIYELPKQQWSRNLGLGFLAALGYYMGTAVGFALKPDGTTISMLWPPNAILLAVFLLCDVRNWWIPILAVLPTHFFIQLGTGVPVTTSVGWFIGNLSEALLGAGLVRRYANPRKMFDSVRGTAIFLCAAVVFAPLTTTFLDAGSVILTGLGTHYWSIWSERFFSNALAELIFVPIIVTFWTKSGTWAKQSNPARYLEAAALTTGLIVASFLAFGMENPGFHGSPALIYVPVSLLLWAALRFGIGGLSLAMLAISLVSVLDAMKDRGPFAGSLEVNVLSLQILLWTVATPLMLLTGMITERKQAEDSLREVAQKLIGAQELERERIGLELHDDIGQQLALVQIGLDKLKDELGVTCRSEVFELMARIDEVSQSARELSHGLHPSIISYVGITNALRKLCSEVSERKSIRATFESVGVTRPPAEVSLCLYRIAQEALQNVVRHSGASQLSVTLTQREELIHLRIADNGLGFDTEHASHAGLGLIGMRERLRILNGTLRLSSSAGVGTTLNVTIPLNRR